RLCRCNSNSQACNGLGGYVRHLNGERNNGLFPAESYICGIFGHALDRISQQLGAVGSPRCFCFYTKNIFRSVVAESSPLVGILVKDYRPVAVFSRDCCKLIAAGGERLAVDQDIVGGL